MRLTMLAVLWLSCLVIGGECDAPLAEPPVVTTSTAPFVTPGGSPPAFTGDPYTALDLPFWTDDFIEPWVPSDIAHDHWSYPWLSSMAEEGVFRRIFPVEEYGHPDPPIRYADEDLMALTPELLDSVVRLTQEGIVIGNPDGSFAPTATALRVELGLVACRTALMLREAHPRLVLSRPPGGHAPRVNLLAPARRYELAEALARVTRALGPMDRLIGNYLAAPMAEWELPPDVPVNHRFAPAVRAGTELGLIRGQPDGTFGGDQVASRTEVALAFTRLLDLLEGWPEGTR
jgi:hypothetical protein